MATTRDIRVHGSISEVAALFTDQPPPAQISELLEAHDKKIYVADDE